MPKTYQYSKHLENVRKEYNKLDIRASYPHDTVWAYFISWMERMERRVQDLEENNKNA